ncbi:SprT-like domain-containing protein [Marinoscillum sp. MHG1-6]|uniref:SprT-like domain-containing protein n=1 Tax=Marinoscillum sp. MHG1-6 TaxID=2959627 RepID=UPI0021587F26|nr:SprT-like domain-containing protein [Marinoscillum sp. MHG1-6]
MKGSCEDIFGKFVPPAAVSYCCKLYNYFGFEFKIKKSRQTKLGDFRFNAQTKKYTITINNDLNPYAFLVTYIHEVAHHVTYIENGRKVNPHGSEWKLNYKKAMQPVLNEQVFPPKILLALQNYFKNPKASSCSDPVLYNVLREFDGPTDSIPLSKVNIGEVFTFKEKTYRKLEKRRTRSVCMEMSSGRKYLIAEIASVSK